MGLFFSAENCPPCRAMLKQLKNFYTDVNLEGKQFEVIYVPSDKERSQAQDHYRSMPWLTFEWKDQKDARIAELHERFEVMGIPKLIIVEASTGFLVTERARKDLATEVKTVIASWEKLLELNKVKGVERAKEDAIAEGERLTKEAEEKAKEAAESGMG